MRTAAGSDEALAGAGVRIFRAHPEILVGVHHGPHLDLFAGVGAGAAYLVRPPRGVVDLTVSGTLGLRVPMEGANLLATARAEALAGGGAVVTLRLQLSFGRFR